MATLGETFVTKSYDKKEKRVAAKKKAKPMMEKKTGEKYASKSAMKKHERSEGKAERMKEYGKGGRRGR